MLVLTGFVGDYNSELDRPQMGLIAAVSFTIILAMLCGLGGVLRQLTRKKKSPASLEEIQSVKDVPLAHEHEVFLSFRGPDTRDNFTDCLYYRLKLAGVQVFLDNENLRVGKEIGGELLKALDKSKIYIPIFSKNYATSSWCLREVAHMVECTSNSDGKKEILPIFFDVDPDDVKLRTKLYKKAIPKHRKKFGSEELKRWEAALVKVARTRGWGIKGKRHGEQIELVVKEVLRKLNAKNVDVPEYLVEDHCQMKALVQKLDVDSDGVRFVGIHGIGGIGKTTIAKVVFNRLSSHFDGVSFLADVRTSYQHSLDGLANLQEKLLSSVLGSRDAVQIKDIGDGMEQIKRVCSTKKVLIVLDDLDKKEQLEMLAGKSDWFGCGSRIIITTRDTSILNQNEEILHYEVQDMEFDRALQLFCKCAFRSDSPMEYYDALSKKIVHKVAGLPLAVELIGSSLYDVGSDLDTDGKKRKLWEETLKQLDEGPVKGVRDVLIISYKGLEDKQREVFLDIACFFTNEDQTHPIIMWDVCDCYPQSAISVLRLRSLIKIRNNKFWMHDQVRDLGRQIILEEYPHRFSRAWIHKDAIRLLGRKERNEDVQALSLTSDGSSRNITLEELAALPNLRFLRVRGIDIFGNFENLLLKLRWLFWQMWQTILRPNNFRFSNLVMLDFSDSDVEYGWRGWSQMKMNKLKVLDLTGCMQLKRTPDFSNVMSLEILILARCVHLTTIDGSIGKLKFLRTLNLEGCSSLGELPEEVGALNSLTEIVMPQNFQRFKLPETFGNLKSLSSIILDEHPGITQLPNSIGGLVKLTHLSLRGCVGLKKLPCSIGDMEMLVELDLSNSGIVELPYSIEHLKKLKVIRVSHTAITKFPHTIGKVTMLEELHAKKCWHLTDENLEEIGKLSHLRILDLSDTPASVSPTVLSCLSHLQTLEMGSSHPKEVPYLPVSLTRLHLQALHFPCILNFSSLINLDYLELSGLTFPTEEPDPSWMNNSPEKQLIQLPSGLFALKLRGISLLPPFPNLKNLSVLCVIGCPMSRFPVLQDLIHLRELKVSNCKLLVEMPGLSLSKNLHCLDLNRLGSLVEINGLSELESLTHFRISHCHRIERLPNLSKLDKLHHIEIEGCPKIRVIEGIKGLESMELDNCGCIVLERLLDASSSTWLSHISPECQVFLSFSISDTYSIVDVLYTNLVRNQISVIRDDDDLSSGDGIGEELPLALNDSRIYIVFLSKNYASSWKCLCELAHMVKCTSNSYGEKRILPIFYDVEVDDVKLESNLYKSALDEHKRKFGNTVEEWEKALTEVAVMQGFDLKTKSHGELIKSVLEEVLRELKYKQHLPRHLVEDHPQIKAIIEKLDVNSGGVRFVGMHGMGGIGKTTLAMVVFDKLSSHFEGVSFLHDIRELSQHGLVNLQKKLLSTFVGSMKTGPIKDDEEGMKWIERVFSTKKVLVVLDNLDKKEQLTKLAGKSNWFGSGSRILITTRDESILMTQVESSSQVVLDQPKGILAYEVHEMEYGQALQLFCKHAFRRDSPIEGYDHIAEKIVRRVGMLPLAIHEIGSIFHCPGADLEPHSDKIAQWEEMLKRLDGGPLEFVRCKLMISYKGLKDKEKEVFLDIACFFTNEDQTCPVIMWRDCDYCPHSAIHVLCQRSLIKIRDNKFWMHDQLRDLGRHIIHEEYPRRFSRVWIQEDVVKLLEGKERNEDVEALSLTPDYCNYYVRSEELAALPNLRFLRVEGIEFFGNFENLFSELRWLSWKTCQKNFHAKNFHMSDLVVLDLSNSVIEDGWDGWSQMKMDSLKVLNLTGCIYLTRTPDFSNFLSLEMLILARCANLTSIDSSIGKLTHLKTLDIKGCSSLGELPAEIDSLRSLTVVGPQN